MSYEARGVAVSMGWKRRKKGDKFQVVIEFDEPPHWPLSTVWRRWPILLNVEPPGDAAAELARASLSGGRADG